MVTASKGHKRGTRRRFKRGVRQKFTVEAYMKEFKPNEKVIVTIDPASQSSPLPRFSGLVGVIEGKRGSGYVVTIKDGNKKKTIITRPEHLAAANKQKG